MHHDAHSHDHHGHHHGPASYNKAFAIGVALNVIFVVIEAAYGFFANSLALLADAGHNLSDVLSLLLAWLAVWLTNRTPTLKHTFGLGRSTILASLINAMLLYAAVGGIVVEAVSRFGQETHVATGPVMVVAGLGVVINTATALLFLRGRKGDINIRGAFLHMAADAAVSVGVVLAALAIRLTGQQWIDPFMSLVIAVVIAYGTWGLLKESLSMALDRVPSSIDIQQVQKHLEGLPGVEEVHDLHIWPLSTTEVALTAHLVRPGAEINDDFLRDACLSLKERFDV
ncbi:MAG: cation diffusion facilitator family transporter, partial [Desulfovibrionaceae bacterium]